MDGAFFKEILASMIDWYDSFSNHRGLDAALVAKHLSTQLQDIVIPFLTWVPMRVCPSMSIPSVSSKN